MLLEPNGIYCIDGHYLVLISTTARTNSAGLTPEIEYRFMEIWPEMPGLAITGTRVDDNIDNPYYTYCETYIDYSCKNQTEDMTEQNKAKWESLVSGEPQ